MNMFLQFVLPSLLSGLFSSSIESKLIERNAALREEEMRIARENLDFQKDAYAKQLKQARVEYGLRGYEPSYPTELQYWR